MKTAKFTALNMEVPIPYGSYYFDDGYVKSLEEHARFLSWKHKIQYKPLRLPAGHTALGRTGMFDAGSSKYVYIFYLKQDDGWKDIKVRAHEETHAMDHMGVLAYLQKSMTDNGYNINLFDYDDETRANIGGWYSLVAWERPLELNGLIDDSDRHAFEILKSSRKESYVERLDAFFKRVRRG